MPAFFHNPIHESESVWWMGLKTLFAHTIEHNHPQSVWTSKAQIDQFYIMFPSAAGSISRLSFFQLFGTKEDAARRTLVPEFRPLFGVLSCMYPAIVECYLSAERLPVIDHAAWCESYFEELIQALETGLSHCNDLELKPLAEYSTQ